MIASLLVYTIAPLAVVVVTLYLYLVRNYNHWDKRNVPYVKPRLLFGNLKEVILQRRDIGRHLKDLYDLHKGQPFVGMFAFDRPALLLRDLELVRDVLVRDSGNFLDRVVTVDEGLSPLNGKAIFALKGRKWRLVRSKLTPTFTSGKIRKMLCLVNKCGEQLVQHLNNNVDESTAIPLKDTLSRFTADVIASCAFGIDSNCLQEPGSEFNLILQRIFQFTPLRALANLATFFAPALQSFFRLRLLDQDVERYIRSTVWYTVQYRENTGLKRKDFLDNLTELRNSKYDDFSIDGDDFVAQAFAFLLAGFHSPATTMTFLLYELALHPHIQTRLRTEILQALQRHGHEVTYEAINEIPYLDMTLSETMRKYPTVPFLERRSLQDYRLPTGATLQAGTGVYVPVYALHHDPEFFPEPHRFDPERFTEQNKLTRPHFAFLPFGEGPRNCIGMRFGLMQVKTGLIHILSRYEVAPCKDTPVPLVLDPKTFNLQPLGEVAVSFIKLPKNHVE